MMKVSDLMTRPVVALNEYDDLRQIERLLERRHIRHLPVTRAGKLVGLVTHRDLIRAMARMSSDRMADVLWAEDIMTRNPRAITQDTPVPEALHQLLDNKFGCLPVVDEQGALVGIVTEADFARLCGRLISLSEGRSGLGPPAEPQQ